MISGDIAKGDPIYLCPAHLITQPNLNLLDSLKSPI